VSAIEWQASFQTLRPCSVSSQPGGTQLLLLDSRTQDTPFRKAVVPTSHSPAVGVDSTQDQPLLFCSSGSERVNQKRLFKRPQALGPKTGLRSQVSRTHIEPLWVLSLPLLCFARHNSASKAGNVVHRRHPPCEFVPFPPDVTQRQRPRGFRQSRELFSLQLK